jgi:hypothetical protein
LETGISYESDQKDNIRISNFTYNSTLTRFGVSDYLELRLRSAFVEQRMHPNEIIESKSAGFGPLLIGAKVNLFGEPKMWPQAAFVGHINLTSGSRNSAINHTASEFRFIAAHRVGGSSILTYNTGVQWDGKTPDATFLYTVSFVRSLTDLLSAFIESCNFFPEEKDPDSRVVVGLAYKLSRTTEWDISAGFGLSSNAPDSYLRTGISLRLFK